MKCDCDFCNDLRNIQPAKYIKCDNKEVNDWLQELHQQKKFVLFHIDINGDKTLFEVDKCPVCKHEFTEEDYDSYF